ncbi:MAG: cytochrome P450 [Proteobacteria bacterium]|nr:cytochrome P450 [Pseudomonadota bacterium]
MVLTPDARTRLLAARKLQTATPLTLDVFTEYRHLLDAPGLSYDERRGSWLAARYADVNRILLDTKTFSSQRTLNPDGSVDEVASASILGLDPPRHRHLRQLLAQAFTQRRVAELEPRIQAITNRLLDAMDSHSTVDVVDALAFPLPVTVIAELLGVPIADIGQFREWANDLLNTDFELRAKAFERFAIYFDGMVEQRRRSPTEDLISAFISAEIDGERLSQRDITGACTLLLIAGHETTASLIPIVLWCLDEHPEARAELTHHPELLPAAIEEALRYRAVVHYLPRVVTCDVEFEDCRLREGDLVLPLFAAANHDRHHFPDPDRFDMRRSPNRHLGFGYGIHLCLGATLARLETSIALRLLLARFPTLARDRSQKLELRPAAFVYSLKHYPIRLRN